MLIDLTDFRSQHLDCNTTLGEIIDIAKLAKLRFYLTTRQQNFMEENVNDDTLPDLADELNGSIKSTAEDQHITDSKASIVIDDYTIDKLPDVLDSAGSPATSTPIQSDFELWEDTFGETQIPRWPSQVIHREPQLFQITVHRGHAFRDLKLLFRDKPDVDMAHGIVTMACILPNGEVELAEDNGGVMRDVLSELWNSFYDSCTLGSDIKVPCLRHDFEAADWKAIAHVLAMGWILQRMIPIRLAPRFLRCCLYGKQLNQEIPHTELITEFLQYVPNIERGILQSATTDFQNTEQDELIDVLSNHDCKVLINSTNVISTLGQIAHKELVQEPSLIAVAFASTLADYRLDIDLNEVLEKLKPTVKRVLSSIDCDDKTAPSVKHQQKYIHEMDECTLRTFLRFTTASDLMLLDGHTEYHRLTVRLVDLEDFARRPIIAHTCGRMLELPKNYESFPQSRSEFSSLLSSNVWVMDIF